MSEDDLISRVDDVVCWVSWAGVAASVGAQMASFSCGDPSTDAAIQRIARQVIAAITWHS